HLHRRPQRAARYAAVDDDPLLERIHLRSGVAPPRYGRPALPWHGRLAHGVTVLRVVARASCPWSRYPATFDRHSGRRKQERSELLDAIGIDRGAERREEREDRREEMRRGAATDGRRRTRIRHVGSVYSPTDSRRPSKMVGEYTHPTWLISRATRDELCPPPAQPHGHGLREAPFLHVIRHPLAPHFDGTLLYLSHGFPIRRG
ncbi:MAG: hypothetical protein JWP03_3540, partial [Phycisphaerales bacterium]|nr:hypothetical protein [Phycisphaerales bacterium]